VVWGIYVHLICVEMSVHSRFRAVADDTLPLPVSKATAKSSPHVVDPCDLHPVRDAWLIHSLTAPDGEGLVYARKNYSKAVQVCELDLFERYLTDVSVGSCVSALDQARGVVREAEAERQAIAELHRLGAGRLKVGLDRFLPELRAWRKLREALEAIVSLRGESGLLRLINGCSGSNTIELSGSVSALRTTASMFGDLTPDAVARLMVMGVS
jgi:hypothetical protein